MGQQQLVPVAHRRQDCRVDAGIDDLAAAGAAHGPLHLVPLHGSAAAAAEPVGAVPGGQVQGRGPGQGQIGGLHVAEHPGPMLRQSRLHRVGHRPEEKEGRLIDLEKVDQLVLLHAQSLYLCRSGEGAGRGQIGFSSGENRDQVAGEAAALVEFVMKYVGKYILDHDMSASLFIWNDAPERENVSQPAF